jgi:hypothetical protein
MTPPTKSDDIKKFIGNIYLEKEQFDRIEDEKPLAILKHPELLAAIREQDFQIGNYYRTFETKFRCLRAVLLQYIKALDNLALTIEVKFDGIAEKIKKWNRGVAHDIEPFGASNPRVAAFRKFKVQFAADSENLLDLVSKLRKECKHVSSSYDMKNTIGFYSVISEALAASFNQYTSAFTKSLERSEKLDKPNIQMSLKTASPKLNLWLAEYTLTSLIFHIDRIVRKDQRDLSTLFEAIKNKIKFVTVGTNCALNDLKDLIKQNPALDITKIIAGFEAISNLEQLSQNIYLDLSLFPEELLELMKKKVTGKVNHEGLVDKFFIDYEIKYTKHTLLIRHCMECSTVGTNKKCLLLLDVG